MAAGHGDLRCPDGRGILRLSVALGEHVVLGSAGDHLAVRRDPGDRRAFGREWIRGDFVVSDATLNRFFAFHVILLPLLLALLVYLHIVALHKVGSNNPDGVDIKKNKDKDGHPVDGVPFHPYYTVKDTFGIAVFMTVFLGIVFFVPEFGGWFLEKDNFAPADILQTPPDIVPLWYLTPYYSILRAVTFEWLRAAPNFGVLSQWARRS